MRIFLALLGLIAISETGFLAWYFGFRPAQPPAIPPAATTEAAPPKAQPANPEQIAVAAEQSVLDSIPLPSPTPAASPAAPAPARRPATPESQVAELIDLARTLRDRGDTGTAMARLRDAQAIFTQYAPIISEMALTYEKMGLTHKALEQWRRIYEMGEKAGIYYAAAEAKLRALQLPDTAPGEPAPAASPAASGGLIPEAGPKPPAATGPVLSLVNVGTLDDTGNTQPLRRLKLRVPIQARSGAQVDPRDVVIQVFFYDQLKDGSIVETNASVISSWARRTTASGDVLPVDWSSPEPEVLEVDYAQRAFDPKDPDTREHRNYFGYCVRVYYKGVLEAKLADPARLLTQFIPPASLPSSDLPR